MSDALSRQIGGNHYKGGGIQPVAIGYANRYDDCIFSAIKYLTRHRVKHGSVDLDKAGHFVELRLEMIQTYGLLSGVEYIRIDTYLMSNGITGLNAEIIRDLHEWSVRLPGRLPHHPEMAKIIQDKISILKHTEYGDNHD